MFTKLCLTVKKIEFIVLSIEKNGRAGGQAGRGWWLGAGGHFIIFFLLLVLIYLFNSISKGNWRLIYWFWGFENTKYITGAPIKKCTRLTLYL